VSLVHDGRDLKEGVRVQSATATAIGSHDLEVGPRVSPALETADVLSKALRPLRNFQIVHAAADLRKHSNRRAL
jgi:hypothetical protein